MRDAKTLSASCSWPVSRKAVPIDAWDWPSMKSLMAFVPSDVMPGASPMRYASSKHPMLRTRSDSRLQPSTPMASTTAMPTGLFAQTPPSMRPTWSVVTCRGKNVGAAAVARAASTARDL